MADKESDGTVVLAGTANLAIAVAKAVAGLLSGSTALLAEAAHSVADTLNQAFLLTALHRSRKPADARHPFGYGMERYFWSLLAAVGILVLGAGFSITEGVRSILHPEPIAALAVIYPVLAASFLFEGASWVRAVFQLRREARKAGVPFLQQLRSAEPAVKTVAFEDSAALVGLLIAAIGVTLAVVTGEHVWDGLASISIGVLLIVVAFVLGGDNKAMLIGRALPLDTQREIRAIIAREPGIVEVIELLSLRLAPDQVLVVATVDLDDSGTTGAAVEQLAARPARRSSSSPRRSMSRYAGNTRASGTCTSTRRRGTRVSACRDPSSRRWPRPAAVRRRRRSWRPLPESKTVVRRTTPG